MSYPKLAGYAVRIVDKIPAVAWAGWIVGVILGVAFLALNSPPVS